MIKSGILLSIAALCCTAGALTGAAQTSNPPPAKVALFNLAKAGVKPIGDWQVDPVETQEINQIFSTATTAANSLAPTPDMGAQRHAINNELRNEVEAFLIAHPSSAYAPSLHIWLGNQAVLVCGYSLALDHYRQAFETASSSPDSTAIALAVQAGGGLSKLLAITGQLDDFDLVRARALQIHGHLPLGGDWSWAREARTWAAKHPDEAYKCGLYCLDQLGRVTQPGQFYPKDITETVSSLNGFTAADLLNVAGRVGLRVHAAVFTDTNNLPVPSIVHLRSQHFVLLRQQRGAFYEVIDPVAYGAKWLTAPDIVAESTGCVIVSDVVPPSAAGVLLRIDSNTAGTFRGRCHGGQINSQNDSGSCPDSSDPDPNGCSCAPGSSGDTSGSNGSSGSNLWGNDSPGGSASHPGSSSGSQSSNAGRSGPPAGPPSAGCTSCGAPYYRVSDPYCTLWLFDRPMPYTPAYGPAMELSLKRSARYQQCANDHIVREI